MSPADGQDVPAGMEWTAQWRQRDTPTATTTWKNQERAPPREKSSSQNQETVTVKTVLRTTFLKKGGGEYFLSSRGRKVKSVNPLNLRSSRRDMPVFVSDVTPAAEAGPAPALGTEQTPVSLARNTGLLWCLLQPTYVPDGQTRTNQGASGTGETWSVS